MSLEQIRQPSDLHDLSYTELDALAGEIRDFIVAAVAENAGHLGSNLGVVELTLALHRVFDSPHDALLWDTGHQAYVHKLVTGRRAGFAELRRSNGLSGYPSREESRHDFVENSHASTILSYAYGLAVARDAGTADLRHVVAVIGDGSMTGGMAYEALNNLGHK
jgi:1-deoxy-D-xylulose-5-phosphate synthase